MRKIMIKLRKALVILLASLMAVTLSAISYAQDVQPVVDDEIEEVIVTGSRIPRKANLISASPVTELSADDFLYQGVVRAEDLLNDLPQTFASNNSTDSNGAVGIATVDLRGMGAARTLVLVDGKRQVRGSASTGSGADLNTIPDALIQRVEVLTGGASSSYGSDAIAGVVNFILDRKFEGFRVDVQQSLYQHSNSDTAIQNIVSSNDGFVVPLLR